MHKHTNKKQRNWESGQSLVEMALGFMLFLFVVLGLLDLGRLFFIYIAMEDSASEAALYLALNPDCPESGAGTECADPNNAWDRARNSSNIVRDTIHWSEADIDHEFIDATSDTEAMVRVTIRYPFGLITPVISDIVGDDTFVLEAQATHVRIME